MKVQGENNSNRNQDQPKNVKSTDQQQENQDDMLNSPCSQSLQNYQYKQIELQLRSIYSNHLNEGSIFGDLLQDNFSPNNLVDTSSFQKFVWIPKNFKNIKRIKKVTNQPKHYFRKFMNCSQRYLDSSVYNKEEKKKVKSLIHTLNYKARSQTKKITMKDVTKLLQPGTIISEETSRKNRQIFSMILRSDLCQNSQEKNKLLHMVASRIYSLRCRSTELIKRNSIH